MMSKYLSLLFIVATLGLSGCNTVKGAGEDVKATGEAISNTAEKAKKSM